MNTYTYKSSGTDDFVSFALNRDIGMGFVVLKAMIKLNGIKTENREPTLRKKGKYILFYFYTEKRRC